MNIQSSSRDMAFYLGIPYDLYDQDPEKWDKVIKIFIRNRDMAISLDMAFYFKIPYDLYDQDPEKWPRSRSWGKVIKTHLLMTDTGNWELVYDKIQLYLNEMQYLIFKHRGIDTSHKIEIWQVYMSSNDYNSDKNIIINYPAGSGGNFLKNCLYFNDSSSCTTPPFFTTSKCTDILVSTLDNIEEKLNYIISETEDQHIWTDPQIELNYKVQDHKILITNGHWCGIEDTLLDGLQIYPNCKTIIYYKNTKLFRSLREYSGVYWWDVDEDKSILRSKQTILQFIKKSQETKKKLIDLCNDEDQVYSHCYIDSKITFYVWDTNWYFSEKDTIDHIKELYELLSLPGFDENAISKYYNVWIKTLSDLKTKALNEIT